MSNFQEMTVAQLKQFLSDHRSNDEMFSDALGELLKRNPVKRSYRGARIAQPIQPICLPKKLAK